MSSAVHQSQTKLIIEAIEKLRSYCQVNVQSNWQYSEVDLTGTEIITSDFPSGSHVQLNDKGQITWASGRKILWLWQKVVVPQNLQGYLLNGLSLRLALCWWADATQIYVNGKLVAQGDLFDCSCRVPLSSTVTTGEEFFIALRLISPGHCQGALVKSQLIYESTDENCPDPGFVADEVAITQCYLETFAPEKLEVLTKEILKFDWCSNHQKIQNDLLMLRQSLLANPDLYPGTYISSCKIHLLGHAHLDLAWLWPVSETWKAAQSTFESVLQLQQEFPELIFCHSTPALYAWVEENRPDLFHAIQQAVLAGQWEVIGGFWVEPDLNLIAGESIVRQLLYGQRYTLAKFGQLSRIVWVPDSFGFCATLPQFFADAGIQYFVTQKLRWNDTNRFEYGAFRWRSPAGREVFSLMSAPIGESIEPVKMASYLCEWQSQTGLKQALWLPGVGDHGGGPTRDMLEIARRWQNSPFLPNLEFTTAQTYLEQIESTLTDQEIPLWDDELYLEFHRGCYTTHADQKRWNRQCENLLYQAELFAALATISCQAAYPQTQLEAAWKKVLFNQFHDILPGSAINQVYADALPEWQEAEQVGTKILQESLNAIASRIIIPDPPQPDSIPIIIFNPLNWERSEVVTLDLPSPIEADWEWQVHDTLGQKCPSQMEGTAKLLFLASNIPSIGYRIFWLSSSARSVFSPSLPINNWVLENEFLQVTVNPQTGDLVSIFDKIAHREILSGPGNQLQAFQDRGQYWDAWNIDPNYAQHPLPPAQIRSIQWIAKGPVESRVRVVRLVGESEFCQDYILQMRSPVLKISSTVNWHENHVLVKAAFPLNLTADFATYEIPCGVIRRATNPTTSVQQAKWEVPALRWADLTGDKAQDYGVSLLNDSKYGYDSTPNQVRLTLLRSSNWPDPQADQGFHEFTYALYPHTGTWESAQTVKRGYELNVPLLTMVLTDSHQQNKKPAFLPSVGQFLNLSNENLILMAFKRAEDHQQQWILRCYECHGVSGNVCLNSSLNLTLQERVDLLERSLPMSEFSSKQQNFTLKPWEIASFKVQ